MQHISILGPAGYLTLENWYTGHSIIYYFITVREHLQSILPASFGARGLTVYFACQQKCWCRWLCLVPCFRKNVQDYGGREGSKVKDAHACATSHHALWCAATATKVHWNPCQYCILNSRRTSFQGESNMQWKPSQRTPVNQDKSQLHINAYYSIMQSTSPTLEIGRTPPRWHPCLALPTLNDPLWGSPCRGT